MVSNGNLTQRTNYSKTGTWAQDFLEKACPGRKIEMLHRNSQTTEEPLLHTTLTNTRPRERRQTTRSAPRLQLPDQTMKAGIASSVSLLNIWFWPHGYKQKSLHKTLGSLWPSWKGPMWTRRMDSFGGLNQTSSFGQNDRLQTRPGAGAARTGILPNLNDRTFQTSW